MPKLKKIKGGKILIPSIPQNVTSSFLRSVNFLFFKITRFFASNRKISLSGAKIIKNHHLKIYGSEDICHRKTYKILTIYGPVKEDQSSMMYRLDI